MRILLAGPCGVGKSKAARMIAAHRPATPVLDVDALRFLPDGITVAPGCALSHFDIELCLGQQLDAVGTDFVIDLGGDTLFRSCADNNARLDQLRNFKLARGIHVVLLCASESVALRRFLSCKGRTPDMFAPQWNEWRDVAAPYWHACADSVIETDNLDLNSESGQGKFLKMLVQ